jgi:cell division protein FtsB
MRRRPIPTLSLSFIDAILCGFGSVVLLFLILSHDAVSSRREASAELQRELDHLAADVLHRRGQVADLEAGLEATDAANDRLRTRAEAIAERVAGRRYDLAVLEKDNVAREADLARLKADLKASEEGKNRLEGGAQQRTPGGERVRAFPGEGDRQYLTGLKVGGERILILLDASASMLAERIVDIVRLRNLPKARARQAGKWQRALATVDWIATQIPANARFQIYRYGETAEAVVPSSDGQWLDAGDPAVLNGAVETAKTLTPGGGTSLYRGLEVITRLEPAPDNVFLITDGLPTIDREPGDAYKISGQRRLRYFNRAIKDLPEGIPVNVVLLPMEGDPMAASAYWRLAQLSRGSFLSPPEDWP